MVSRDFSYQRNDAEESEFQERVINISRVTKVVKGGRNLSFAADVVIGDGKGTVGIGRGKASAVPDAVRKGVSKAKRNMITVSLDDSTIPHEIVYKRSLRGDDETSSARYWRYRRWSCPSCS